MSVVSPALSSTSRRKNHYRGREIGKREKGVDPFACNQVRLLLAGFGYQIMHVQRALLERMTGTGWSLGRLADRVLGTSARFTEMCLFHPPNRPFPAPAPALGLPRAAWGLAKRPSAPIFPSDPMFHE